jgi:hypothetical protein
MRRRSPVRSGLAALAALAVSLPAGRAAADVELAPGPHGGLGAFLVAGPLKAGPATRRAAMSVDFPLPDGNAAPTAFALLDKPKGPSWVPLASASGALDLRTLLKSRGSEATAAAFGVLRATAPFKGYLLLGVDDGVQVELDGKRLFARDERRAFGEDDCVIPVELAAGDHPLLLKLHQRGGGWTLKARLVAADLSAARGVSLVLPGAIDAGKLAGELAELSLDRGLTATGLSAKLRVSFAGGLPRAAGQAERGVKASARVKAGGGAALFEVSAGQVPLEDGGPVSDLVVSLPPLGAEQLAAAEAGGELVFEASVGGVSRSFEGYPRKALREALARGARAREVALKRPGFLKEPDAAAATIDHLSERLTTYAGKGDHDVEAQLDEAAGLDAFAEAIEKQTDPFEAIRGPRRVAYRSPLDGRPSPFGLYLPPDVVLDGTKRYPLVVALHGLNGKPLNMMRWVFGRDDGGHDGEWEDRHVGRLPVAQAIVVTPMAHFNGGYRYASEEDVVAVMEWARKMFPVDNDRVSITGPSMGGTGTAWVAFRYADRFSAAAPLCGYHSYSLRHDMAGRPIRPWERALAEERSTVSWAPNGLHLPLWIVHGTRDLPEENSGVLIDRYKSLGYSLLEEHPDEGHNVWQPTYEGLKGISWLTARKRPAHPSRVVLKTDNLRYDRSAWVKIDRLERSMAWGEVRATAKKNNKIELKTSGVLAISLDRDEKLVDAARPLQLTVDGAAIEIGVDEPVAIERRNGQWQKGHTPAGALAKRPRLAGPLRDVHHEPMVVVYGTADPLLARANEELARWFAAIKGGFDIGYPVMADADFDPALAKTHAVVLVGSASSNTVTRALDERLPIHVSSSPPEVRAGGKAFKGEELGAAFIYPNPDSPSRYVVVLAGADVAGTLRLMSLPDLLPDFVITDAAVARSRWQMVLGAGSLLAGGMFDEAWQLPAVLDDPKRAR